jgi:hypothetical protein
MRWVDRQYLPFSDSDAAATILGIQNCKGVACWLFIMVFEIGNPCSVLGMLACLRNKCSVSHVQFLPILHASTLSHGCILFTCRRFKQAVPGKLFHWCSAPLQHDECFICACSAMHCRLIESCQSVRLSAAAQQCQPHTLTV